MLEGYMIEMCAEPLDVFFLGATGFTEEERDRLGLRGLLPPRVTNLADQKERILENFRRKPSPLEQYIYLTSLQDRNEHSSIRC